MRRQCKRGKRLVRVDRCKVRERKGIGGRKAKENDRARRFLMVDALRSSRNFVLPSAMWKLQPTTNKQSMRVSFARPSK